MLKTLIPEKIYQKTVDKLTRVAHSNDHLYVTPTPIISPFWNTTFTPSSTEVVFRGLSNNPLSDTKIYTIQPCIRINDLPYIDDGRHMLLFHMFSLFLLRVENFEDLLDKSLQGLVEITGLKLSDYYFTVSSTSVLAENSSGRYLGAKILQEIGVSEKNIIFNAGSDNYQSRIPHKTENRELVAMTGPKIEIYVRYPDSNSLYEVGTCLLGKGYHNDELLGTAFAFAIGLERTSAIAEGKTSVHDLQLHEILISKLSTALLHPSMASTPMGKEAIVKLIRLVDALATVTPHVAIGIHNRGVMNHYRRMVRELVRTLRATGISLKDFYRILSENLDQNIEELIYSEFLKNDLEEMYSEYV
jgi:alanyl-tRNA synthetase